MEDLWKPFVADHVNKINAQQPDEKEGVATYDESESKELKNLKEK